MDDGDILVCFTDGVTEARNSGLELYGKDRIRAAVQRHFYGTAREISDALIADIHSFMGEEPQYDDITVLILKKTGN